MSPFLASKSSAGNKKRLAGYYRKNKVKPILDEGTEPWGVMVERVEVKDVR